LHPDEPAQPARVEDASGGDVDAPLVLAGPRATQLGTWWVDLSDRQAGAIERPLCVNLPVGESDLAAATGGELSSGLGETPHEYVPAGAEFLNRQEESRRELWPTILTVLIVTLMAEQGLAWWFGTPKRGGSRFT